MFDFFSIPMDGMDQQTHSYDVTDPASANVCHVQTFGNHAAFSDQNFNPIGHAVHTGNTTNLMDNNFHSVGHVTQVGNTEYQSDSLGHLTATHTTLAHGSVIHNSMSSGYAGYTDANGNSYNNFGQQVASFKKIF